ncbi:MAG: hypothetical protein AAGA26_03020, partial [Pseudomonadota bacterium]
MSFERSTAILALFFGLGAALIAIVLAAGQIWLALGILWWLGVILYAAVCLHTPRHRATIEAELTAPRYRHLYEALMTRLLARVSVWVTLRPDPERARTLRRAVAGSFTWRLFDRALLIAVFYPLLLVMLSWVLTGQDGRLGAALLFPAEEIWWIRWSFLGAVILALTANWLANLAAASGQRIFESADRWLPPVIWSVAVAVTVTVVVAVTVAVTVTVAVAVAVAVAVTVAGAFAVAVTVAVTVAVAVAGAVDHMVNNHRPRIGAATLIFAVVAAICTALLLAPWDDVDPEQRSLFLFLGVLPLLNGLFDAVSYSVTLGLTQRGLAARSAWAIVALGLLDLVIALGLFFALAATLLSVLVGMNALSGVTFVDPQELVRTLDQPENLWVWMMICSTLVPTGIHVCVAL